MGVGDSHFGVSGASHNVDIVGAVFLGVAIALQLILSHVFVLLLHRLISLCQLRLPRVARGAPHAPGSAVPFGFRAPAVGVGYDEATVRDLTVQLQQNDRLLRPLIHAIVQSDTFLMKQLPE